MKLGSPLNFKEWIEEHRHLLKPPVGNQVVWKDKEFIIMVVGGPNAREDYHVNCGEEFFYQLEGNITLRVFTGEPNDIPIREGEIFLLPPKVPHSPQRPANTVGLVIERRRLPGELDTFQWYCKKCHRMLHAESLELTDIVKQLPPVFDAFYKDALKTTCAQCGTKHARA